MVRSSGGRSTIPNTWRSDRYGSVGKHEMRSVPWSGKYWGLNLVQVPCSQNVWKPILLRVPVLVSSNSNYSSLKEVYSGALPAQPRSNNIVLILRIDFWQCPVDR